MSRRKRSTFVKRGEVHPRRQIVWEPLDWPSILRLGGVIAALIVLALFFSVPFLVVAYSK